MPAWELPDSIAALLAHYPPGEWTPIRRVPFGFLACSWLDSLPARESLAKIRPRWDRSASESVSQRRSRAIEALRKQGEGCRDEDTLGLSLRLAPAFRRPAQEPGPTWLGANSSVLPASVKSRVWMKSRPGARDTLGPFRSVYGTWMLAPSPSDVKPGRTLDSTACLARAEAGMRKEEKARRIRSEWEILASEATSKMDSDRNDVRTALLEQLAKRSSQPESSYREMRERWASRSLRFTRDMGFLDAAPETGKGRTE
jgi:hypothetical protein